MIEQYRALQQALKIIDKARLEVYAEEKNGPAWLKLFNAGEYLKKQAEGMLSEGAE